MKETNEKVYESDLVRPKAGGKAFQDEKRQEWTRFSRNTVQLDIVGEEVRGPGGRECEGQNKQALEGHWRTGFYSKCNQKPRLGFQNPLPYRSHLLICSHLIRVLVLQLHPNSFQILHSSNIQGFPVTQQPGLQWPHLHLRQASPHLLLVQHYSTSENQILLFHSQTITSHRSYFSTPDTYQVCPPTFKIKSD